MKVAAERPRKLAIVVTPAILRTALVCEGRRVFDHAGEDRSGSFSLLPGAPTENVHIAFPVGDNAAVAAFHRKLTEAGYRDTGAPGERPVYHAGNYGAYVLDPDG